MLRIHELPLLAPQDHTDQFRDRTGLIELTPLMAAELRKLLRQT